MVAGEHADLKVRYPAFDLTPAEFITHYVGLDGLYTPETFRRQYQGDAAVDATEPRASAKYLLLYGVPPPSQYSFLLSALKAERAESLLVPEMRPELWGARVVVAELLKRKAPTTVIADNMMGTLFAQGEIGKLCFFYDSLAAAGPQGICGSLSAVQLARLHGVPIELFSGDCHKESTAR